MAEPLQNESAIEQNTGYHTLSRYVRPLRSHSTRLVIGVLSLLSWFLFSNHCAVTGLLADMQQRSASAGHPSCCHKNASAPVTQPPADQAPCTQLDCCKKPYGLPPVPQMGVKPPDFSWATILKWPLDLLATLLISPSTQICASPETGPPTDPPPSFAELVLQQSLRSHAPPSRA